MTFDDLVEQYISCKSSDNEEAKIIIQKMKEYVDEQDDELLYARFAYYEGEYLYYQGKTEEAYYLLQEHCLPTLKKKKYIKEIILAHNMIGIVLQTQYEYLNAVDQYMQALDVALDNEEYRLCASIYNNISNIFAEYEDYDREVRYLFMSLDACEKVNVEEHDKMIIYLNLALTYARVGAFDEVKKFYNKSIAVFDSKRDRQFLIILKVVECLIACSKNDRNRCYLSLTSIIDLGKKGKINVDNFKEVLFLANYTSNHVGKIIIEELFEVLKKQTRAMQNLDFEICLYEEMIHYYLKSKQDEKVSKLTLKYYELSRVRTYRSKKLMLESIDTKFKIYQLTKDNLLAKENMITLKVKSEMDVLTKLLNRSALESIVEDWFEKAKQEQLPMAVEIIDVDYFKQFNDTYGHIQGDQCLKTLAEVMDRMNGENILFIRYGGDEFLAFYLNHSKEKVMSLAKLLKSEIRALNIEHASTLLEEKKVSITQGIFYGVPQKEENIFDFIRKCDDSLYEGKTSRSSISFNER